MVVFKGKVTYTSQWGDDWINTGFEGYGRVNLIQFEILVFTLKRGN